MNHVLIMAGGLGTRLWPLSRENRPKQSLRLIGERTMFQNSVERVLPLFPVENIWVITNPKHARLLQEQVPELFTENFILEPEGRGTAPAIGLAAIHLRRKDPEAVMTVLTADHHITNVQRFLEVLLAAEAIALQGYLVTLGIQPTYPSTGYGYIQHGDELDHYHGFQVYRVQRFTEKPDRETAELMIASKNYSWNSGMFIWNVEHILQEFEQQIPKFYAQLNQVDSVLGKSNYQEIVQRLWPNVDKQTIDYGIMEGAQNVAIIPVEMGWIDIGSWGSLVGLLPEDDQGNTWIGPHTEIDTNNSLVFGGKRLIATIGIRDMVIVDTDDVILICAKQREQEVRQMVELLNRQGKTQWL